MFSVAEAATVPSREEDIQSYPGAVRNRNAETRFLKNFDALKLEFTEFRCSSRSYTIRVFNSFDTPETVFSFYQNLLGGEQGESVNPGALAQMGPGTLMSVNYSIQPYDRRDLKAEWIKSALKTRPVYEDGKWIEEARFVWCKNTERRDWIQFLIVIKDAGLNHKARTYRQRTEIDISTVTYHSDEVIRTRREEKITKQISGKAKKLAKEQPTEATLGVPIYPGASFDLNSSAKMTSSDYAYYIYKTNDEPGAVAEFYTRKTGKQAEIIRDLYDLIVSGKKPLPELQIWIQPNTLYGGRAKTAITIRKKTDHPIIYQ
jgi:hypothetical protein